MPRISEFYGIANYMYFMDQAPPHFHAIYGGYEAEVEIASGAIIKGRLPKRAERLVVEWAEQNRRELQSNWTSPESTKHCKTSHLWSNNDEKRPDSARRPSRGGG